MKCDELKVYEDLDDYIGYDDSPPMMYDKFEADAAIAELKAENRRLKRALWIAHKYKAKFKRWWLQGALDYEASMIRPDTKTIKRIKGKIENCEKSERKCCAQADEYGEDK